MIPTAPPWQAHLDVPAIDRAGFTGQFLKQTDLPDLTHLPSKLRAETSASGMAALRETLSHVPFHMFYLAQVEKEEFEKKTCWFSW